MRVLRLHYGIMIAVLLAMAVAAVATVAPRASAAEVVTSLSLEGGESIHLYVDHETAQLKALAAVEGVAARKDVTQSAVWSTTSETVVKVDKGKLTPTGGGSAKVTAKYGGKTVSADVTVEYLYTAVRLSEEGPVDVELRDEPVALTAAAVEEDGTSFDVTTSALWTSSDSSIATVDKGRVRFLKAGTVTITAKTKGRSDSIVYRVTSPYQSLEIEWDDGTELDFVVGQTGVELDAVATLVSGSREDITGDTVWASSNPSVVSVTKGKLTFKAQGVADITAARYGHTAKSTIVVRLPYQALLLTPSKPVYTFADDAPVQVKAEVANDFETRFDVSAIAEWTTSNPLVATVQHGIIRPRSAGTAEVAVTYKGLTKKLPVTVMPVVDGVKLDKTQLKLFKDEVARLPDVYGADLNGTEYSFAEIAEWSSSDEEVVVVENGKLKARRPGTAQVTMRIRGATDTLRVEVREKVLALFPSAASYSLVRGESAAKPTVKALLEDGREIDVTSDIEWSASSPNLLVNDSSLKALLHSRVTLMGSYLNKNLAIPVVIEDKMSNVEVSPASMELNPKRSKAIKVTAVDSAGKTVNISRNVVWTTSDPSVAEVSGSTAKAVTEGTATLTANYQGQPLSVTVIVSPKLEKLAISETSAKLAAGGAHTFRLIAYFDNGKTKDVTNEAVWTSSDVFVGTVQDGRLSALKKGYVTVKAKYGTKTANARITVTGP